MLEFLLGVTLAMVVESGSAGGAGGAGAQDADRGEHPRWRATLLFCEPEHLPVAGRRALRGKVVGELGELGVRVRGMTALEGRALRDRVAEAMTRAGAHGADAVVWLERSEAGERIYLLDVRGPHMRQRLIYGVGSAEIASEEIMVVLRSALTAIVEDIEAGLSEVALPGPSPAPAAALDDSAASKAVEDESMVAPTETREVLLGVRVGYAGASYARVAPWQHGLSVGAQLRPWRGAVYADLSHTFAAPMHVSSYVGSGQLETILRRRPTELFFGWEMSERAFRWGPELGLLLDRIERTTPRVGEPFVTAERFERWQLALGARVRVTWRFDGTSGFTPSCGADFPLGTYDQAATVDSTRIPLLEQRSFRPRLDAGLFLGVW